MPSKKSKRKSTRKGRTQKKRKHPSALLDENNAKRDAMEEDENGDVRKSATGGDAGPHVSGKLPIFHRPQPGENLVLNSKAYDMRHILHVTWPCMSFDIVMDQEGLNRIKYPLGCTIVTGCQADDPKHCEIMVKKIQYMCRTKYDQDDSDASDGEDDTDEEEEDAEEVENEGDPIIYTRGFSQEGSVLRIRAMKQHPGIVASWSDTGHMAVYDLRGDLRELSDPKTWLKKDPASSSNSKNKVSLLRSSEKEHTCDGFALQWSGIVPGMLASGDSKGRINVWRFDAQGAKFTATPIDGHKDSVEDLQWSPNQENVLASCSVDGSVRLWDIRDGKTPEKLKWEADKMDINVISWNENADARQFLVTGSDSGFFKVWDLRMVKRSDVTPIFASDFHRQGITSVEWSPINSSLLAVASQDMVTFWDFSVERDEEAADNALPDDDKIPPQVMFIHQGVHDAKELHWHPQLPGLMICTDLHGFQFFKPSNWKSLIK